MHDAALGEQNSPDGLCSNARVRARRADPERVVPPPFGHKPDGRGQVRADRNSGTPPGRFARIAAEKRVGGVWGSPDKAVGREALRGKSPREHPAIWRANPRRSPGTLERVKTQEPRLVGPALRFGGGNTDGSKRQVGASLAETPAIPFGRRKLRRAETQERCRRERKPARTQRAKAVERVAKPCGRTVAGDGIACGSGSLSPARAEGSQSP